MAINTEKLRSSYSIFIIYSLVSIVVIMVFRFIVPGAAIPLIIFSREWRLIQGVLELINFFPAFALSALILPFAIHNSDDDYNDFHQIFYKRLIGSVITAICAASLYGVMFFLLLPLAKNYEENLSYKGELYILAKEQIQVHIKSGEWQQADYFYGICDQIWSNNRDLDKFKTEIEINLNKIQFKKNDEREASGQISGSRLQPANSQTPGNTTLSDISVITGESEPPDAAKTIVMSETAFKEKRYFDSHWLAALAQRIAIRGSPEAQKAARIAGEAWNMIEAQAPNSRERQQYTFHEIKLSGYKAMNSENWIQAYYIFIDLAAMNPNDPDTLNFLAACERGAVKTAFFTDEMNFNGIVSGALFSVPGESGRAVLRLSNLSSSQDVSYGRDMEYMEFDSFFRPIASVRAPYVKITPITRNEKHQTLILTHSLNRYDKNSANEGEWLIGDRSPGGIILDISYEDLLLLSNVRRGLPNLQINDLLLASKKLNSFGYISQIFDAEILNRIGSTVFFLPIAFILIALGWRYRTKAKARYMFILMIPALPVVLNVFVLIYRSILNILGIWLVITIGFSSALIIYIVVLAVSLFVSLIVLVTQHN